MRKSRGIYGWWTGEHVWLPLFIIKQSLLEKWYSIKQRIKIGRQQSPSSLCAQYFCQTVSPRFLASMREQLSNNKHNCTLFAGLLFIFFWLSYCIYSMSYNRMFCNKKYQHFARKRYVKVKYLWTPILGLINNTFSNNKSFR